MQHKPHTQIKPAATRHKLARLRRLVARHEPAAAGGPCMQTGFAEIDAYLDGQATGLPCGGVHEVLAGRPGDMPAALGFAHHLAVRFLGRLQTPDMLLYGQTHTTCREAGQPYGPALAAHGLTPERLLYLDGATLPDLLWAGEEALHCAAIGCSLLASWEAAPDFTASRRLTLAARAAGRPLLIALGSAAAGTASAAATRWQVESLPHRGWQVSLRKLRMPHTTPPPVEGWAVYPQRKAAALPAGSPDAQTAQRSAAQGAW